MSFSSAYQGLHSCLEPRRLVEPHVLQLNMALAKPDFSQSLDWISPDHDRSSHTKMICKNKDGDDGGGDDNMKMNQNAEMGGWSFLQSLCNNTGSNQYTGETENCGRNKGYVHPLVKRPSSKLNDLSLEMCTESLGSETGNDSNELSLLSIENVTLCSKKESSNPKDKVHLSTRSSSTSFPPPITSIGGSSRAGVKVKSLRVGGRLVLQAVTVTPSPTYFHAERSEGRLRLCLLKDCSLNLNNDDVIDAKEEEEEEYQDEEFKQGRGEEEEEEEEGDEGIDANIENVGGEMGIEKLHGLSSRCKEGDGGGGGGGGGGSGQKGLLNWEPYLVAT